MKAVSKVLHDYAGGVVHVVDKALGETTEPEVRLKLLDIKEGLNKLINSMVNANDMEPELCEYLAESLSLTIATCVFLTAHEEILPCGILH